jgi:hypothetical protein
LIRDEIGLRDLPDADRDVCVVREEPMSQIRIAYHDPPTGMHMEEARQRWRNEASRK